MVFQKLGLNSFQITEISMNPFVKLPLIGEERLQGFLCKLFSLQISGLRIGIF